MATYDGGLASRFANRGKPGYTFTGGVDWKYRGGDGPDVVVPGTENWSAGDWKEFAAKGGSIGESMSGTPKLIAAGSDSPGWMGKGGYLDMGGQLVGALSSGLAAYTGLQELGMAKDKFSFEKDLAKTNMANQASLINTELQNRADVGMALAGNTMTPEQRAAAQNKVKSSYVSGNIG